LGPPIRAHRGGLLAYANKGPTHLKGVNQWITRAVKATLVDVINITAKKVDTTNPKALLNGLGSGLIYAILGSIADDMANYSAAIS